MRFPLILSIALPLIAASSQRPSGHATAGCGNEHYFNGITQFSSITSSGRHRTFSLHLPFNYDKTKPYPLVLGFHGSSSIGLFFEADTKLSEYRFSANKIMVYPDGVGGNWAGANYSQVSVAEDLRFVADLLGHLRTSYCLDNDRIYATGMSIGGGFVNTIACSPLSADFAAFAPASGSFYTDDGGLTDGCSPAYSPTPILEIHGDADRSVPYKGGDGEGGREPAILSWLQTWAIRNQCSKVTQEDSDHNMVHHLAWTCNATNRIMQHYRVDTMGHCWASTEPNFSQVVAGESPTYIQASSLIMKFFDMWQKPV